MPVDKTTIGLIRRLNQGSDRLEKAEQELVRLKEQRAQLDTRITESEHQIQVLQQEMDQGVEQLKRLRTPAQPTGGGG